MKKTAFIPGSFDPITLGHYDLIERASKMFEKVVVAVMINGEKNTTDFDYEYNLSLINRSAGDVETLLLPASPETAFISSTMVREFLRLEKDVTKYIPQNTKIESAGK